MTNSIKQAQKLINKFFHPETGEVLRDFTPYFSKKAEELLSEADNEIYEYNERLHTGLLIIANPDKDI